MAARNYDIITVGGGIAASSLARAMAERGARVLVLEREKQSKDRVRGEAVVSWGVAEANELGICRLLKEKCGQRPRPAIKRTSACPVSWRMLIPFPLLNR